MDKVRTIIFSRNRSMQLDCLLRSFKKHCEDLDNLDIAVLYKVDQNHKESYQILEKENRDVLFVSEDNFKKDLLGLVKNHKYIFFLVDDCIFTSSFNVSEVLDLMKNFPESVGFSFRLGYNCVDCYPLQRKQQFLLDYYDVAHKFIYFRWDRQQYDLNYPLELSSSLFPYKNIQYYVEHGVYANPNDLEALMDIGKNNLVDRKYLLCPQTSVAFCDPINRVQNVALANRCGNNPEYSIDSLLNKFMNGYRIDIDKFSGFISDGAHQEVGLDFIKLEENAGI